MKAIFKFTTVLAFAIGLTATLSAQDETHLKMYEVSPFQQLKLDVDADVVLLKSNRNHITFAGDSAYVFNPPITQENGVLTFNYSESDEHNLTRVVIEYTDINHVTTSGKGEYYFHKLDAEDIKIFNNSAKLVLSGKAESISIQSEEGSVDVTDLKAKKLKTKMGEAADLLVPEEIYTVRL